MNDLISRQAAIDEIARWIGYLDKDMIKRIQIGLKRLPSAQLEQRWIPCNEKMPKNEATVLVTVGIPSGAPKVLEMSYRNHDADNRRGVEGGEE